MVTMKKKSIKYQSITELLLVLAIIVLANLILSNYFFRIDLTKEKRFKLSKSSIALAEKVNQTMFVKVYLEGEFPSGFKRLRQSTKEMLDEFRVYSNNNIQYEFIDPFKDADEKKSNDIIQELGSKGLQPTNVQIKRDDEFSQKIIVPGAIFFYNGREFAVNLLKSQFGAAPEETINSSIELMEYEFANVLRKATEKSVKKIGFIHGHGELDKWDIAEAKRELEQYYTIEDVDLSIQVPEKLKEYAGIIIARPALPVNDFDKFKIDQYIMNGGKVLWLVETQLAEMDSLYSRNMYVTPGYPHGLEEMLFSYGARVNQNIVQDLQCNGIPVLSGLSNGTPQQKILPWMFYPVISPSTDHPIVKNIDPIWHQFTASIDTTGNKNVKKTVLLQSSEYSRVVNAPIRVDLTIARLNPEPALFRGKGNHITAILLEGAFNSTYRYRYDASKQPTLAFKDHIDNNKMIVVADGDVIRNQYKKSTGEVFPLGYDRYTNQQFGNARFILNCMDYMCDDSGIIEVRAKEITLRLLDKGKIKKEKLMWQVINMALPITIILLFGLINRMIRNRKYS
jgi:ABC-2 type transport system permease protein